MAKRQEVEAALEAWQEAERRLRAAGVSQLERLRGEANECRAAFQRLSGEHMQERMDALRSAEDRRHEATPSTLPFHQAARDEMVIVGEIWDEARQSDQDTPKRLD